MRVFFKDKEKYTSCPPLSLLGSLSQEENSYRKKKKKFAKNRNKKFFVTITFTTVYFCFIFPSFLPLLHASDIRNRHVQRSSKKDLITFLPHLNLRLLTHNRISLLASSKCVECLPIVWETWVQSQVESYQRLKKWYLMPSCLTLSIIRYVSRLRMEQTRRRSSALPYISVS